MITWGEIIGITLDMFPEINQTKLAKLLNIDKSALSRIKNGKRRFCFENADFYNAVFNPNNPQSPAHDKSTFLLELLKDIISKPKYAEVKKAMEDCWDEDYKNFAMQLLNRTRNIVHDNDASAPDTPLDSENAQKAKETASLKSVDTIATSKECFQSSPPRMSKWQRILPPHSVKCCFYCTHWRGNSDTVGAYMTTTYGRCLKYNKEGQASSTPACKDYSANPTLMNQLEILGTNTEDLL